MIGLQIVVDIVLAYLLIRIWMERKKDSPQLAVFDRESREAMETYRDELEDLLNRLESRIAEERRALTAMADPMNAARGSSAPEWMAQTMERNLGRSQEKIRELNREGLSTMEIARETGSGAREVKLILSMGRHEEGP